MNDLQPVAVGLIGCGNISGAYMRMLKTLPAVQVVACADLRPEAAQALADQYALPSARSVDALLADPSIEVVLNLTIPQAHGAVALAALEAGKSVYNEKPLALTRAEGQRMLLLAAQQGLRVGGAPDTFLGGGLQTCRQLIDEGAIGTPVAATAFMTIVTSVSFRAEMIGSTTAPTTTITGDKPAFKAVCVTCHTKGFPFHGSKALGSPMRLDAPAARIMPAV